MKNIYLRIITGTIFVAALVASIGFSPITFYLMFSVVLILTMKEFYSLTDGTKAEPQKEMGIFLGWYLFTVIFLTQGLKCGFGGSESCVKLVELLKGAEHKLFAGIIAIWIAIFIYEIYRKKATPFKNIAYTLLGVAYISLPYALTNLLVFPPHTVIESVSYYPNLLIAVFIIIWVNDSGAFLVGVSIGRRRLFERISPKKSWEGAIGGVTFSVIAGCFLHKYFIDIKLVHMLAIALVTSVSAIYGDLVESVFKRTLGIKDSGNFFPGHGGLLDRFDSVLIAVPVVLLYIIMIS